jgi:RimK family alpha-L-glutamate ligase
VVIVENAIRLRAELDLIRELDSTRPFLVQEWLGDRPGTDVRVFVLGYRAIAAMRRRSNNGDFRASYSQGGDVENLPLTEQIVQIGECICRKLGLEIGGVDLLYKGSGFAIAEVNSSPGFRGLSLATGLDIAERIASYLNCRMQSLKGSDA